MSTTFVFKKIYLQEARSQLRCALRQKIQDALWAAQYLPTDACLIEIRNRLAAIQQYCDFHQKKFIFVEETIACNQFELAGFYWDSATLFRGPSKTASVAICVTHKGSLLYRNDSPWEIYRNAGDVKPVGAASH